MTYIKRILFLTLLLLTLSVSADDDEEEEYTPHEIKALKTAGKITSLERILDQLKEFGVARLLEVELIKNRDHPDNSEYLYEIEYIDHQGMVLELEVDALTSQILHHNEDDDDGPHHRDDD